MKNYSFAPIAAREYPTVRALDNPYIWGGVSLSVNVSEKPYSAELVKAMKEKGIEWIHCPVSEEPGQKWLESLLTAVAKMLVAYEDGKKIVVHCDFGNNRSRSFVEALYFAIRCDHLKDEYKGEVNHLVYNCKEGHLPELGTLENLLLTIGD